MFGPIKYKQEMGVRSGIGSHWRKPRQTALENTRKHTSAWNKPRIHSWSRHPAQLYRE